MSADTIHALVLTGSGFGCSSCYALGVAKALLHEGCDHTQGQGIDPQIYAGTVFSAFNAAYLAAPLAGDAGATLEALERIWLEEITGEEDVLSLLGLLPRNGVFRMRFDPRSFLDVENWRSNPFKPFSDFANDALFLSREISKRMSHAMMSNGPLAQRLFNIPDASDFFDTAPLRDLLQRHIDLERLRHGDKQLRIVATDWKSGNPAVFRQDDLTYDQLMGSLAVFALFPRVTIDGRPIAGGGIASPTPVRPAIQAAVELGAKRLIMHVVYLRPRLDKIPPADPPSTFDTFNRLTYVQMKGLELRNIAQGLRGMGRRREKHRLDIHVHNYRPKRPLWDVLETLSYNRKRAVELLSEGCADALEHNCEIEGCAGTDEFPVH